MALAGPSLSVGVAYAFTPRGRSRLFQIATCQFHIPSNVQATALLAATVLSAAITLTFVTATLQNERHGWASRVFWVLALLFVSPLGIPAYWFFHLRGLTPPT
jgi:hypothetical protein